MKREKKAAGMKGDESEERERGKKKTMPLEIRYVAEVNYQ